MRSYLVFILALLGVLIFDGWGQSQLKEIAHTGADMVVQEQQFIQAGQWEDASALCEELSAYLEDNDFLLSVLVEHERIDMIRSQQKELAALLDHRETTLARIRVEQLKLSYEDLYDSIRVSWENII